MFLIYDKFVRIAKNQFDILNKITEKNKDWSKIIGKIVPFCKHLNFVSLKGAYEICKCKSICFITGFHIK